LQLIAITCTSISGQLVQLSFRFLLALNILDS